jgi:hypothetical protein
VADVKEILVHWDAGATVSQIARTLTYSRPTVRKYVEAARRVGLERGGGRRGEAAWDELASGVVERVAHQRPVGAMAAEVGRFHAYLAERLGVSALRAQAGEVVANIALGREDLLAPDDQAVAFDAAALAEGGGARVSPACRSCRRRRSARDRPAPSRPGPRDDRVGPLVRHPGTTCGARPARCAHAGARSVGSCPPSAGRSAVDGPPSRGKRAAPARSSSRSGAGRSAPATPRAHPRRPPRPPACPADGALRRRGSDRAAAPTPPAAPNHRPAVRVPIAPRLTACPLRTAAPPPSAGAAPPAGSAPTPVATQTADAGPAPPPPPCASDTSPHASHPRCPPTVPHRLVW